MKYAKLTAATGLKEDRVYQNGDVYLTAAQATAIEAALETPPTQEDNTSNVQALQAQLETANASLASAQSRVAELETNNAALQAENTRLGNLPAANNAAALTGTFQEEQPGEEGAPEPEWNNPELAHNKAAAALGLF